MCLRSKQFSPAFHQLRLYCNPFLLLTSFNPCLAFASQQQVVSANVTDHRGSNYSGGVRQFIQAHLTNNPDYRITGVRSDSYLSDMKRSKFCLAPEGKIPSFRVTSPKPVHRLACTLFLRLVYPANLFPKLFVTSLFPHLTRMASVEPTSLLQCSHGLYSCHHL